MRCMLGTSLWFRNASPDRCGRAGSSRYHRTFAAARFRSTASRARDVGAARRAVGVGGALRGPPGSACRSSPQLGRVFTPRPETAFAAAGGSLLTPVGEALLVSVIAVEA